MKLQLDTLVGSIAKIIRFPFLDMTFMTFQERACILEIHGLNLKGRVVGGGQPSILIKKRKRI